MATGVLPCVRTLACFLKPVIDPSFLVSTSVIRAANPHSNQLLSKGLRSYTTSSLSRLAARPSLGLNSVANVSQRRWLFGYGNGSGSPSQSLLINMEKTANNNPSSASAQNAFYSALLRANMPNIVVERFQTGTFASNKACEDTYQRALERVTTSEGGPSNQQIGNIATSAAARMEGSMSPGRFVKAGGGTGERSAPIYVQVDESRKATLLKWAKFIVGYGLAAWFVFATYNVLVETFGILKKTTGVQSAETAPQQQTARFSDVHGCDEAKEELQELVEFLKNPEKFSALGGKLPKGVLLVGPPGTGKTLLARAVAGEAGVPFFYMSGSEFDEMYVGVGAKRVRELFAGARAKAPAIVFIDELDAVGAKRNERDPAYVKQSLNQLLTELDGFTQETGVIILGATNFPKLLDKALTRPGRFDRNVEVPLPDVRGRMKIVQHYLKQIKVDSDVEADMIARGTSGFSGAQLESLVNQAAVHASKNKTSSVTMLDMEWAKDKIMMGAEKRSMIIKAEDKLKTAYHEAGHALVALYTKGHTPIYKATIMPRGMTLGVVHYLPEMDVVSESKEELTSHLDSAMAGKAAEVLMYGDDQFTSGCSGVSPSSPLCDHFLQFQHLSFPTLTPAYPWFRTSQASPE